MAAYHVRDPQDPPWRRAFALPGLLVYSDGLVVWRYRAPDEDVARR
jgi:hypothetical protein